MREILFRAWNGLRMMEWDELQKLRMHTVFNMCQTDLKLMQFTGAKDFFGANIFEGDIVFIDSRMIVGEVVMDTFAWRIKYGNDEVEWLCDYFEDIQVIGNIHEHPALLEQQ
jgi:uncharacterized phage protein (TIGR01671 family)